MKLEPMTPHLAIVLASIVCHTEEMLDNPADEYARAFDTAALRTLLDQPVLRIWLRSLDPALLPVRR
jgi:hypothetical protein